MTAGSHVFFILDCTNLYWHIKRTIWEQQYFHLSQESFIKKNNPPRILTSCIRKLFLIRDRWINWDKIKSYFNFCPSFKIRPSLQFEEVLLERLPSFSHGCAGLALAGRPRAMQWCWDGMPPACTTLVVSAPDLDSCGEESACLQNSIQGKTWRANLSTFTADLSSGT